MVGVLNVIIESIIHNFIADGFLLKYAKCFNWCFSEWGLKGLKVRGVNLAKCLTKVGKMVYKNIKVSIRGQLVPQKKPRLLNCEFK